MRHKKIKISRRERTTTDRPRGREKERESEVLKGTIGERTLEMEPRVFVPTSLSNITKTHTTMCHVLGDGENWS